MNLGNYTLQPSSQNLISESKPEQNNHHFLDNIFKYVLLNENYHIFYTQICS